MRVLIVGCGYVGAALGAELAEEGHEVFGLRRTAPAHLAQKPTGITPLAGDVTKPDDLANLPREYDWVVNCISSSGNGVEGYRQAYLKGTRNLIQWLAPAPPKRFVYTSSTSVYGQTRGEVVTETSLTEPIAETARILLESEAALLEVARGPGFPATILRVAGIYGPGRGHWFQQFLRGEARLEGKGERILNMIHRDDVVRAIISSLTRGQAGQIYNAVDDEPVSQFDFFQWLAKVMGKEMPVPAEDPETGSRSRGFTNKRVSNTRLRTELKCQLKYPTFREGYLAELQRIK